MREPVFLDGFPGVALDRGRCSFAELDPAFVLLALQAVAAAGIVFPGDVRRITGEDPTSKNFAA